MKQRRRIYYSAAQRSEIWNRWQAGWGGAFRHSICGEFFPTECAATAKARAFVDFFERSFDPRTIGWTKSRAVRPVSRIGEINEHMFEPR